MIDYFVFEINKNATMYDEAVNKNVATKLVISMMPPRINGPEMAAREEEK